MGKPRAWGTHSSCDCKTNNCHKSRAWHCLGKGVQEIHPEVAMDTELIVPETEFQLNHLQSVHATGRMTAKKPDCWGRKRQSSAGRGLELAACSCHLPGGKAEEV